VSIYSQLEVETMSDQTKNKTSRRIIRTIVGIALFLVIAYLGIGGYAISELTKVDQYTGTDTPDKFGVEYEEVNFPAREDGLQIAAWYLPNETSDKAIIIVHGRKASKQAAATGTIVAFETELQKAGYTVLAIDLRAHGDSDGDRFSFGVYERRDVLGAVDFLKEQGFESGKIGVVGISLGGAAVNEAMAESEDIGAVVTEGTFGDFEPIIYEQWENESGLPNFFLPGVFLMNRILFGYSLADVHPAEEIANASPRPMLVIHCTEDDTVNINQSEILLEAAPHAESWIQDNCEHGELHRDYPEEYCDRVIAFFDENL
jgi:dipeptidyl aminopeptidase/acylaminoacyl peptidase